jgi:hypothetical protein
VAVEQDDAKPPPRPSPSPPRTKAWKGSPQLLAEAFGRAGLELGADLNVLPGDMLSMQHHTRKQQVRRLLNNFGPAKKLLEEMEALDPRLIFAKTTIYLALKLWSKNTKKLAKQGRKRLLHQELCRLFLFAKGARALKQDPSGDEGNTDQDDRDLLAPELFEEEFDETDEAAISHQTCCYNTIRL